MGPNCPFERLSDFLPLLGPLFFNGKASPFFDFPRNRSNPGFEPESFRWVTKRFDQLVNLISKGRGWVPGSLSILSDLKGFRLSLVRVPASKINRHVLINK